MFRRVTNVASATCMSVPKRDIFFARRTHRYPTAAERAYAIMTRSEEAVCASIPAHHRTMHQADTHLVEAAEKNARRIIAEQQKKLAPAPAAEVKK